MPSPDLIRTLVSLAQALADAQEDWWIIGSAAVVLHGVTELHVADVDVLLSEADARHLLPGLGLDVLPGRDDPRFRSRIFASWRDLPLTVELMAGFDLHLTQGWTPVHPVTRQRITLGAVDLFVPDRAELLALLAAFDRPKDHARAGRLAALD